MSKILNIMLALVLFVSMMTLSQGEEKTWAKTLADFKKEAKTSTGFNVPDLLKDLAAMAPQNQPKLEGAIKDVLGYLADLTTADDESKISSSHLDAVEVFLVAANNSATFTIMSDRIRKGKENERFKYTILKAISKNSTEETKLLLRELSKDDKYKLIKMLTITRLSEMGDADSFDMFVAALGSQLWEIRLSAIDALGRLGDKKCLEPLINAMKTEKGRLREDYQRVLKSISGVDNGLSGDSWALWLKSQNAGGNAGGGGGANPNQNVGFSATSVTYYDDPILSKAMVFILDISGSMSEPTPASQAAGVESGGKNEARLPIPPGTSDKLVAKMNELRAQNDMKTGGTKIEAAQKELINTLLFLPADTFFGIVFYSSGTTAWKNDLVQATLENKIDAIDIVSKQGPTGMTNIYDALELAMKMVPQKGAKPGAQVKSKGTFAEQLGGADTIYLLTDGMPNQGKVKTGPEIQVEIKKINETRKIKINTIGVGAPGTFDENFLTGLATDSGGKFIRVK